MAGYSINLKCFGKSKISFSYDLFFNSKYKEEFFNEITNDQNLIENYRIVYKEQDLIENLLKKWKILSFDDKLDITTSLPFLLSADGTIPSGTKTVNAKQIDGLSTALQQMHLGDRWVVYVPHQYGYGTVNNSSPFVPAYSTLIFDITLVGIYHSGDRIPKWN